MEKEYKELLLKDLCARLPYGVMIEGLEHPEVMTIKHLAIISVMPAEPYKPYLRPMSDMTEEECIELSRLKPVYDEVEAWKYIKTPVPLHIANIKQFDFFNSHHLDWRGLIEKDLALKASIDMYKL